MTQIKIRLTDATLFGNDAAEDEEEEVFRSYAVNRPEVAAFADTARTLAIARAYKGEGKSALLRLTELSLEQTLDEASVLLSKPATELVPEIASEDYSSWTKAWKASIFGLLANELGARSGFAWSDDSMRLVEEAERNGFRARGIVGAILERLSGSVSVAGVTVSKPQVTDANPKGTAGAVRRRSAKVPAVWVLIDDLDKNFENTPLQRRKIASFFDAAREIVRAVPELHIRTAIRPNVWATIKMEFESLSHIEQYVIDLKWTEDDARELIARRLEGYLRRNGFWDSLVARLPPPGEERDKALIGFIFESPMHWGGTMRPPHLLVYTLSKHRPRWMVELCKVAAKRAEHSNHSKITQDDLVADLGEFGDRRIQDTVAEFKSQCGQIEELITAFNRQPEQLSTDELLKVIENKIVTHVAPRISGVAGQPKAIQIAAFLYEIGFIFGRRDHKEGSYTHVGFAEKPALLRSRADIDAGLSWEVHPVFRQSLEMRDAAGKEIRHITPKKLRR